MENKKRYERPVVLKQFSGFMNKFGSRPTTATRTEVDGIPVNDLVQQYGSPLFVISERKIRENQRRANRIFKTRYPKVQFAWSYKTNYLNAVCSVFHQEGSWAEVVSGFEYDKARSLGVKGEHIIFNGPDKDKPALRRAISEGAKIHIDHFDELYDIIEIAAELDKKAIVAIRVNMDTGIYPKWDRFGFNYENGEAKQALRRIMTSPGLKLTGLHTHIGTYMMSVDAYKIAADKMVELAGWLKKEYDHILDYIDLGGGFPSNNTLNGQYLPAEQILPTLEQFADVITTSLLELPYPKDELPVLFLETGRALIDDAANLISTVLAMKRLSDGRRAMIIDAGVNLLFTKFWYKHQITPAQDGGMMTEETAIYGPLCMNIDVMAESITLPVMKKGDKVVIDYVGAYDMTQWMQFIQMRPNVVMIMEDKSIELIREAESLEYLATNEKLPEKLKSFKI